MHVEDVQKRFIDFVLEHEDDQWANNLLEGFLSEECTAMGVRLIANMTDHSLVVHNPIEGVMNDGVINESTRAIHGVYRRIVQVLDLLDILEENRVLRRYQDVGTGAHDLRDMGVPETLAMTSEGPDSSINSVLVKNLTMSILVKRIELEEIKKNNYMFSHEINQYTERRRARWLLWVAIIVGFGRLALNIIGLFKKPSPIIVDSYCRHRSAVYSEDVVNSPER